MTTLYRMHDQAAEALAKAILARIKGKPVNHPKIKAMTDAEFVHYCVRECGPVVAAAAFRWLNSRQPELTEIPADGN